MNKKAIAITVILFGLIVVGMLIFAYIVNMQNAAAPSAEEVQTAPPAAPVVEEKKPAITKVDAKHYYTMTDSGGVHTLAGEVVLPMPCAALRPSVVLLDNGTRAVVSFDILTSDEECEMKPTTQRFKTGFRAEENIKIEGVFEGESIPLTLTKAGPGESPADFQLYPAQ